MTKKKAGKKIPSKKSAGKPVRVSKLSNIESFLNNLLQRPSSGLIKFDLKTILFISTCTLAFWICIALKWNYSSMARWNEVINDGGDLKRGLVIGTPKKIRSDEWLVSTSFMLSQHELGYPIYNESLGEGKVPLLMGLPTTRFISKIKPSMWGFYLFDIERAYSWYWNFKIFPFLVSAFLVLMLFTNNNYWLSIFGAFWLLMSSAVLWWSIATEPFTFGFWAIIALIYLIYSKQVLNIILQGIMFIIASFSFVMILYPAWQVPLAYVFLALLLGYLLLDKNRLLGVVKKKLTIKSLVLIFTMSTLIALILLFFKDIRSSYEIVSNTVYPGKRVVSGGDFPFIKLFQENYSLFTDMLTLPANWINICELSSFLILFPFCLIIIIVDFILNKKIHIILLALIVVQIILFVWLVLGFPMIISKLSLLSMSPTYRTVFIFGFANVLFTILYIHHHKNIVIKNTLGCHLITLGIVLIISGVLNYFVNKHSNYYFSSGKIWLAVVLYSLLIYFCLFFFVNKYYKIGFYLICIIYLIPNFKINPINDGLSAYYDNEIFKVASEIEEFDPDQGWIVFGQGQWGNFLKAAGINCFNGVKFAPHLDKMHILDTYMSRDSVYNRYAHILYASYIYKDSVHFMTHGPDVYSVQMDPCSPKFKELGIKYFLFTYMPPPEQVRCMTVMMTDNRQSVVYKRNDL